MRDITGTCGASPETTDGLAVYMIVIEEDALAQSISMAHKKCFGESQAPCIQCWCDHGSVGNHFNATRLYPKLTSPKMREPHLNFEKGLAAVLGKQENSKVKLHILSQLTDTPGLVALFYQRNGVAPMCDATAYSFRAVSRSESFVRPVDRPLSSARYLPAHE